MYSEAALKSQSAKIQADILFEERELLVNANEYLAEENKRIRNAFLNSRSWKVTAFLRAIRRMTGRCLNKRYKKPFRKKVY